jgi:hypothetical protein
MLVLRSPDENRWDSAEFIEGLEENWNVAYFEARGIGATGWSPNLQWHIRRASAWTGRTVASMRVYDVLRCLQVLESMQGVDSDNIAIAARGEMCVIALYTAFLHNNTTALLLQNPPQSQDTASSPDGRGPAIEMLNSLRITDLSQIAGLLYPGDIAFIKEMPEAYKWAANLYAILGKSGRLQTVANVGEWQLQQN